MSVAKISRREWLRTGTLVTGGMAFMPYLGHSAPLENSIDPNVKGILKHSPIFKEYLLDKNTSTAPLMAKLNANENPYGPSPKTLEALKGVAHMGNRYAWRELFELMGKIAEYEGVKSENIIMGPGSSDILEKTAMVFFSEGGNVVSADPSYMSLMNVAEASGGTWKPVPLKDWSHDLEAMEAAVNKYTKLVYICNPNNPTGTITDSEKLYDFCSRVSEKVPVFVDEAYLDFIEDGMKHSMVSLVNEGKNIIVARTFSKIHGMAGLRVGYAVAQPETIERIHAITRGGMGISYPSIYAAMASMDDKDFLYKSRTMNAEVKKYVFESLIEMGHEPVPSYTSFMIFPIEMDGKPFLKKMSDLGVGVRAFEFMEKNWCRVSMGTMNEMKIFVDALRKVLV
jgi:histidinol-phosphate aminotransferase